MNAVLQRELVVQARQTRTYWLRFIAGAALAATLGGQLFTLGDLARALGLWRGAPTGSELFAGLHTVISVVLLFTAPLIAADSIARERREGTLGLLALTPLQPFEIVLGKVGAHVIRLFSLWLLSVPMLMVPVMMGGVNWVDIKCALSIELTVLFGGLAAGLTATSVTKRWNVAAVTALGLTLAIGQIVATAAGIIVYLQSPGLWRSVEGMPWLGILAAASVGPWLVATGLEGGGFGPTFSRLGQSPSGLLDLVLVGAMAFTCGLLLLSVFVAGWRIRWALRVEAAGIPPRSARRRRESGQRWFGRIGEAQRRQWLMLNPARWLFAYAQFAGSIRWAWCALVLVTGVLAVIAQRGGDNDWTAVVAFQPLLIAIGTSLAAAASFRREIEESTLELLLVTGLPARQLVSGRVWQIWSDSWPALALSGVCLAVMLITGGATGFQGDALVLWLCGTAAVFGSVPIGARYAVRRLNPLHGWLWTVATAGFPPFLLGGATSVMFWGMRRGGDMSDFNSMVAFVFGFTVTQFALARTWYWLAANDLHTRLFMLKPFQRRPS